MTITRTSHSLAGNYDADPASFLTIVYDSDSLPFDLSFCSARTSGFSSVFEGSTIQPGWEGSVVLSNADRTLTVSVRPVGGWQPCRRNTGNPLVGTPQQTWPDLPSAQAIYLVSLDYAGETEFFQDFADDFVVSHPRGPLALELGALPNGDRGSVYVDREIIATSNTPTGAFAWTRTGTLPTGLTFVSDGGARAVIRGTCNALNPPGDHTVGLQVSDGSGAVNDTATLSVAGIVLELQTPAFGAVGWDPALPLTMRWRAWGGVVNPASVGFNGTLTSLVIAGVAQPGYEYSATPSEGGAVLTVTFRRAGGWLPSTLFQLTNYIVSMSAPEADEFLIEYGTISFTTADGATVTDPAAVCLTVEPARHAPSWR